MRRSLTVLLACLAAAVPLAACGGYATRSAGGGHRLFHGAVCAYSVWRGTHDARTHHYGWAAFQLYLALHHCPRALRP